MQAKRSLVLVTVDCFRADHAGFLGYERPTTPFLDSLAGESLVFSNAIVAGAPTYFSFPAIMSSRYPLSLGRDVVGLAPEEPTLATVLREKGYATGAFLAANPYLSPRFGYDAGFDTFRDFLEADAGASSGEPSGENILGTRSRWNLRLAKISHELGPIGSIYDELYFQYCQRKANSPSSSIDELRRFPAADQIVDHAQDWLSGVGDQPFFLWLHLMDPHSPYYPRQEALDLMGHSSIDAAQARYLNSYWNRGDLHQSVLSKQRLERHRENIVALYDAGIRWMDVQMARLVKSLRGFGLWENCLMALTADHGEEFLDHGGRYHPPSKATEELIRVPLLLRGTDLGKPEIVAAPFSLLHLAPTFLHALEVPAPASFRGSNYSALRNGKTEDGTAIVESVSACSNPFRIESRLQARLLAVREARYKLVLDFNSAAEELFDLEADPGEKRPLPVDQEKAVRRRLLDQARKHVVDSLLSRNADDRMAARLRDLRLEWGPPGADIGTARPTKRASA